MKKLLATTSVFAMALMASQAHATEQAWPKWYVGLSGGLTFLPESDISGAATGSLEYDAGGMGAIAVGYTPQTLGGLRLELEMGYHANALDSSVIGGVSAVAPGHMQAWSYMGNLYYDFRNSSAWTPYIGGGAGMSRLSLSANSGIGNTGEDDNVFSYQGMAGISYSPSSMPLTEWSLGYRYFALHNPQFRAAGGKIKMDDIVAHTAEIGARFKF